MSEASSRQSARTQDVELYQRVIGRKGIWIFGEWYFDSKLVRYFGMKVEVRVVNSDREVLWVALPTRLTPVARCVEPDCDICVASSQLTAKAAKNSIEDNRSTAGETR